MKKLLAIALVAVMAICCMTACGGNTTTEPTEAPQNTEAPAGTEAPTETEAPSNALTITGWKDLDGLKIGFQSGTTAEDKINELMETGSIKCTTFPNESVVTCFKMLENGEIDAVVTDDGVAKIYCTNQPDQFVTAWTQEDSPEEFGIAMPKEGSADLKSAVDEAIEELKSEGFLDALYNKWFGDGKDVTMPTEKTVECKAKLITEGTLTVGAEFSYPPFETEENGVYVGFDVDLTTAIATKLGLQVKYVNHAFDTVFATVGTEYDVVASAVTIRADRLENMAFSTPYINNYLAVAVNK